MEKSKKLKTILIPCLSASIAMGVITPIMVSCAKKQQITMTFVGAGIGGTVSGEITQLIPEGTLFKDAAAKVFPQAMSGYAFSGWYKNFDPTSLVYSNPWNLNEPININPSVAYPKFVSEDTEVTLTFTSKEPGVTFTGATTQTVKVKNKFSEITKPTPSKDNYRFVAWTYENGEIISNDAHFSNNTTIYAKMEQQGQSPFESDSWANVITYANQGLSALQSHYGINNFVGLVRKVHINGIDQWVVVVGQEYDKQWNSDNKVALTFQFLDVLCDAAGHSIATTWNGDGNTTATSDDYTNTHIRKALDGMGNADGIYWYEKGGTSPVSGNQPYKNKSVLQMITDGEPTLAANIKSVKKQAHLGNSAMDDYEAKIFNQTTSEIRGSNCYQYWADKSFVTYRKHQIKWKETPTHGRFVATGHTNQEVNSFAGYNLYNEGNHYDYYCPYWTNEANYISPYNNVYYLDWGNDVVNFATTSCCRAAFPIAPCFCI